MLSNSKMRNLAIKTENLIKNYGSTSALKGIELQVPQGSLFGLIGPDGAGKTSLIRILATLLLPDTGTATVLGHQVVKEYRIIRKKMGYMPGRFSLYQDLSVLENLQLFAAIYDTTIEKNYHLIKDIYQQIEPFKHRRAGQLSGGMKQKLALSCALIHQPEILFLDEPTTGVDPVSRNEFWDMLKNLRDMGITILVSTPYMDEAKLCDSVALIQEGTILTVDTPEGIIANYQAPLYAIQATNKYQLLKDLKEYPFTASVFPFGAQVHYTDLRGKVPSTELQGYLEAQGHSGVAVRPITPNIEDCFMAMLNDDVLK